MTPINLQRQFGDKYRISYDPCYDVKGTRRATRDPWMMQIPCRRGVTIFPHSDTLLAVELDRHNGLAKRIASLPGVQVHQDGEQEKTILFPVCDFDTVAAIVQPKKRRILTEEQKERLAAMGKANGFGRTRHSATNFDPKTVPNHL